MGPRISLFYSDAAYTETTRRLSTAVPGTPVGLMGRQVAGKEFLNAYLTHGSWAELTAVIPDRNSVESIQRLCLAHDSSRQKRRRLRCVPLAEFNSAFSKDPPARLIHFPCPADARFAWARQHMFGHPYALCGVTHTLCSLAAVQTLRDLIVSPFESCDRLVCTSQAVRQMANTVISNYSEYLCDRFGGTPHSRVPLEVIPLGVDCERHRPATTRERQAARAAYRLHEDEIVVLFVGRLSHHAKANPYPLFCSLSKASAVTGRRVALLMSGWAANDSILKAFERGAQKFAANINCRIVNGMDPEHRQRVWQAADIFISLADSIQETFGLVIVEALANGLPVVATDWDGYRDLVVPGHTGFLATTRMLSDAGPDLTMKLLTGELNYDHFLARSSQQVIVDVESATRALIQLMGDDGLRQNMSRRARHRALNHFDWSKIVACYEAMWEQQLRERAIQDASETKPTYVTPCAYPKLAHTFAAYPTSWIDANSRVITNLERVNDLDVLMSLGLTNFEAADRCGDSEAVARCLSLAATGCDIHQLLNHLSEHNITEKAATATVAWMLKYDLIRLCQADA